MSNLLDLPAELIIIIAEKLDPFSLQRMGGTCRALWHISRDPITVRKVRRPFWHVSEEAADWPWNAKIYDPRMVARDSPTIDTLITMYRPHDRWACRFCAGRVFHDYMYYAYSGYVLCEREIQHAMKAIVCFIHFIARL